MKTAEPTVRDSNRTATERVPAIAPLVGTVEGEDRCGRCRSPMVGRFRGTPKGHRCEPPDPVHAGAPSPVASARSPRCPFSYWRVRSSWAPAVPWPGPPPRRPRPWRARRCRRPATGTDRFRCSIPPPPWPPRSMRPRHPVPPGRSTRSGAPHRRRRRTSRTVAVWAVSGSWWAPPRCTSSTTARSGAPRPPSRSVDGPMRRSPVTRRAWLPSSRSSSPASGLRGRPGAAS